MVVPAETAFTTPEAFIVATPGTLLFHTPPAVASVNVVVPFTHREVVPPMGATTGDAFTTCDNVFEVLFEKLAGSSET